MDKSSTYTSGVDDQGTSCDDLKLSLTEAGSSSSHSRLNELILEKLLPGCRFGVLVDLEVIRGGIVQVKNR